MKDLVIGAVAHYSWKLIEPWAISLEKSGYDGDKVVIAYDITPETAEWLIAHNFKIRYSPEHLRHFNVDRYLFFWQLLQELKARYVIVTDTRDLIFQTNPSTWLEQHLAPSRLIFGSECLSHKDESFANDIMKLFYGSDIQSWMQNKTVYNAGSFAGQAESVRDLCLAIYLTNYQNIIPLPTDQAALNVLIHLFPWKEITFFSSMADGWACQAGTVAAPDRMAHFRPHLKEPEPVLGRNDLIYPAGGETPFCIVHQYDRNPSWKSLIMKRYSSELL